MNSVRQNNTLVCVDKVDLLSVCTCTIDHALYIDISVVHKFNWVSSSLVGWLFDRRGVVCRIECFCCQISHMGGVLSQSVINPLAGNAQTAIIIVCTSFLTVLLNSKFHELQPRFLWLGSNIVAIGICHQVIIWHFVQGCGLSYSTWLTGSLSLVLHQASTSSGRRRIPCSQCHADQQLQHSQKQKKQKCSYQH